MSTLFRVRPWVLLLAALAACGDPAAPGDRPPDVLLVSLDTLRADRVSCYGAANPTTPFLDSVAAEGVRFAHGLASASHTAPSHMSLFTGLDPIGHGVHNVVPGQDGSTRVSDATPLLPELAQLAGYRTVALTDRGNVSPALGFARGFDVRSFELEPFELKLRRLAGALAEAPADRPLFLFLHTYEPHAPYLPPAPFRGRFTDPDHEGPFRDRYDALAGRPINTVHREAGRFLEPFDGIDADDYAFLSGLYDEGVAYTDSLLERAWETWCERRDPAHTLLVVLSDHGEELGEGGRLGHAAGLSRPLVHVPLVVRGPGVARGAVVDSPVSLVDVLPTFVEWLDLDAPPGLQGRSLAASWRDGSEPAPAPAAMQLPLRHPRRYEALAADGLRLVVHTDLEGDATERLEGFPDPGAAPAGDAAEAALDRLRERLVERRRAGLVLYAERGTVRVGLGSSGEQRELEALGYTEPR